jgi:hypothetical protein
VTGAGRRQSQPKHRSEDWLALARAAVQSRDDLRSRARCQLDRALALCSDASVLEAIIAARSVVVAAADRLRIALKGRSV